MSTKLHPWRSTAVALLFAAAPFTTSADAMPRVSESAAILSTALSYDARAAGYPSAQYGLAVYDRSYARVSYAHGYYRHPYGYGYRYPYYRPYYPYYYPYYSYYYPFAFYGAWGYPGGYGYSAAWMPDSGALDLNVKPKRAEVWIDREYVGSADSYDGFPRYLWLPSGEHHLLVYLDGYETFARDVSLRSGEVLAVRFDLREGVSTKPDEIFASLPPKPEQEQQFEPEEEEVAPERHAEYPPPPEYRAREERRERPRTEVRDDASRVAVDQRAEPGHLRLEVTPSDAVVYLDGRLLGSGDDLARLHSDLLVDSGTHRLEVTRPGYRSWERDITVGEGEEVVVRAELETQ